MRRIASWIFVTNFFLVVLLVVFAVSNRNAADPTVEQPLPLQNKETVVAHDDLILTMLSPYVHLAVTGRYGAGDNFAVQTAPYSMKIVSITQPDPQMQYTYEVKVYVEPYAGAHHTIGEDELVFEISPGTVFLKEYLHVKSYPLPEYIE